MSKAVQKILPFGFDRLFRLFPKLLRNENSAGKSAIRFAFLGVLLMPLDYVLSIFEKKRYARATKPQRPILLICGPPRSGTTLVAQVFIKYLPVYFFNNLTSVFPNSPIVANELFGRKLQNRNKEVEFKSLFGRTKYWWSPNDALYFWDRWRGVPRNHVPSEIKPKDRQRMIQFFGAVEEFSGKPLINKTNELCTYASHVTQTLDTAHFICLKRDPVYLAQSILLAGRYIHGDERTIYGVQFKEGEIEDGRVSKDAVERVCQHVLKYQRVREDQLQKIGSERFTILPYEEFCENPVKWVTAISKKVFDIELSPEELSKSLKPFKISASVRLDPETFNKIESFFKEKSRIQTAI